MFFWILKQIRIVNESFEADDGFGVEVRIVLVEV